MAESKEDLQALRQKLGIGNDVTDAALETLLSSKNGKEALKKIEAQPNAAPEGGIGGFLHDKILGPLSTAASDVSNTVGPGDTPAWILENIGGLGVPELVKDAVSGVKNAVSPSQPKAPAKKPAKDKPLGSPQDAATNAPESPFTQLAQALASEYLGQVQQLMPLTSGSALFGPQGDTTGLANSAAAGIGGPAGSWLQGLASQEQSDASKSPGGSIPSLQGSMNQVGEAASKGAIGMSGAIANMGPAETQFLQTAPWQQILSELASETAYKAASGQGASAFGLTPQNTPAWLSQVLQSHGLAGTAAVNAGLTSPSTAAKGGSGSTSSATSSGTSQTG